MGGAKRYPSIASYGGDGFRGLNPSYVLSKIACIIFIVCTTASGALHLMETQAQPIPRTMHGDRTLIDACVYADAARNSVLAAMKSDINGLQMAINC
jgi:hypothetical protein